MSCPYGPTLHGPPCKQMGEKCFWPGCKHMVKCDMADEIKIKYIDPEALGEGMRDWLIMSQPHHTRPPDAAQIAEDGYVEMRRMMTRDELKQLYPESLPPLT